MVILERKRSKIITRALRALVVDVRSTLILCCAQNQPTIITDAILIFVDKYVSKRHNTTIQQVKHYLKTYKNILLSRTTTMREAHK